MRAPLLNKENIMHTMTPTHRAGLITSGAILDPDRREAFVEALLSAWGVKPKIGNPLVEAFDHAPLSALANICGQMVRGANNERHAVIARGISTHDFAATVADAAQTFAVNRYRATAKHLKFTGEIEAKDFRPVAIADVSIAAELQAIREFQEITPGTVRLNDLSQAQLISFGSDLRFTRAVVVNDQHSLVKTALAAMGSAAARTEAKLVYDLLSKNPVLADGSPLFHAEFGNLLGSLSDAGVLASAMAALRDGTSIDENIISDSEAAHLVVAANLELFAKKIVHESGLADQISVTATAYLPDGEWYLLPDPQIQPVISVVRLKGSKNPVRIEPKKSDLSHDGFAVQTTADLGAAVVSRFAVRGGV
jgi:hypothetical protein